MATVKVNKGTATVSKKTSTSTGGTSSKSTSGSVSSGGRTSSSTYKGVTTTNRYDGNNHLISSTTGNSAGTNTPSKPASSGNLSYKPGNVYGNRLPLHGTTTGPQKPHSATQTIGKTHTTPQ